METILVSAWRTSKNIDKVNTQLPLVFKFSTTNEY